MGALIRLVCEHLAGNAVQSLDTGAGLLELRGRQLRMDGVRVEVAPAPMLLLRALLGAGGAVVSRGRIWRACWTWVAADHALDMTVSRLRASLPDPSLVETVVKRGYRLRI